MNKIFKKIVTIFLAISIPLTVLILFIVFDIVKDNYIQTLTRDLEKLNVIVQENIRTEVESGSVDKLRKAVNHLANKADIRITIIGNSGKVIADNEENPDVMENHAARIEIAQAFNHKAGSSVRYSNTVKKKMLYVAMPFYIKEEVHAVVRVSLFIDEVDELYAELRNKIVIVTVVLDLLALFLIYVFSRKLTNPVSELVAATKKFSSGDFNSKVIINQENEFKELADAYNLMTDEIKNLFEMQTMQQEELKRIIGSMQEGLIVLDNENKIIIHNKSFKKTFGSGEVDGRLYWEILKDVQVQKLVDKVRKKKSHKTSEINFNDIYYLCSANYIQTKDEIVIVLFDISERKLLEEMKRDFIVNVSHELRTPLTAIRGFIETMEDEAEASQQRYLEILSRHTSRLIAIVEDLITISKLEDEKLVTEFIDIDFIELLTGIITIFDDVAKEKNIQLKLKVDEDLKGFKADYFKLEQLFINLIDNAIKYTKQGEVKIKIKDKSDSVVIEVRDTGIGIPNSELGRIFERFYTIDKSRARKKVGTGLGLSIVKHIVNLHSGSIDVQSAMGVGTTFTVVLPKENN